MKILLSAILGLSVACVLTAAENSPLDTNEIEKLTGLKGALNDGVFKVTAPRTDVKVAVDQWEMPPFMGLTSWAAFTPGKTEELMMMGDLVLMEDEVNPVMSVALEFDLNVTALHNHFFLDDPKVYFMHIAAEGRTTHLCAGLKALFERVGKIRAANPAPAKSFGAPDLPKTSSISARPIERMLGVKGQSKDGMFKIVLGRSARMSCGCVVSGEMGVNTWAAFAGSDENAVVAGDFAVREEELQPLLRMLRRSGIQVVAIHHHMTRESPRYLFVHYWGRGRASDLARGLQSALEAQMKVP